MLIACFKNKIIVSFIIIFGTLSFPILSCLFVICMGVIGLADSARCTASHTHTHTHPFNGHFSGTTQVSRYQKGKTNLDFTKARDSEWQWNPLGHMQVCTSLQTDNHTSASPLSFFTGWMPFLPPNQQRQSTEGMCSASQPSIIQTNSFLQSDHYKFVILQLLFKKTFQRSHEFLKSILRPDSCLHCLLPAPHDKDLI